MSEGAALDLRLVPAAMACWLACGVAVGGHPWWVAVAAALVLLPALVLVVAATRDRRQVRWTGTSVVALVAAAVGLASCAAQLGAREGGILHQLVAARSVVTVVGVVRAEVVADPHPGDLASAIPVVEGGPVLGARAESRPDRFRTVVSVERVTGRGQSGSAAAAVLVRGGPSWRGVTYGSRVRVTGRLTEGLRGERTSAGLMTWGDVETIDPPGRVDATAALLRRALLEVTDPLPADLRGLVPGAAIGDTSRVPASLGAAMRSVGLTHVTAVSGSHFAVLALTVLHLTGWMRLPRAGRAAVSAVVLGGFVVLVHPDPSVVRAAVMGAVAAIGLLLGRRSSAVPALMAAVVVLLVLDPWLARSFGFALSVLATASIVLVAPPVARLLGRWLPGWLALAVAVPAAAQLACAPVVVLLDPAVSLVATPANLLAAPALVPATLLGLAATLTAPWWPGLAGLLAWGAAGAAWWIAAVARAGASLDGARLDWPEGVPGGIALLAVHAAAAVGVLGYQRLRRERRPGLLLVALVLGVGLVPAVRSSALAILVTG